MSDVGVRPPVREVYLGDGLYASFDGWQFRLRAPTLGGDEVVYLEPAVLQAFWNYVKEVNNNDG